MHEPLEYVWEPFALVFTSEIGDDLKAILSISSAIIPDSVSNDMIVGTFDKTGADGIAFQEEVVIVDSMLVFPKVASFGFERIPYFEIPGTPYEVIEGIEEPFVLTLIEIIHTLFNPLGLFLLAVWIAQFGHLSQVGPSMSFVQDFYSFIGIKGHFVSVPDLGISVSI